MSADADAIAALWSLHEAESFRYASLAAYWEQRAETAEARVVELERRVREGDVGGLLPLRMRFADLEDRHG